MSTFKIAKVAEIKARADLADVWAALRGGKLQRNRGKAFWRGGDGYSVSLDLAKGLWFDHRDGTGGDVVELVRTVRQCTFHEAVEWLAQHCGIPASESLRRDRSTVDTDWKGDLERATYWAIAAEVLAEGALEDLPVWHPERRGLTNFLRAVRLGDASMVHEYREWRRRDPGEAAAMVRAGRLADARQQRRLALDLRSYLDGSKTAFDAYHR